MIRLHAEVEMIRLHAEVPALAGLEACGAGEISQSNFSITETCNTNPPRDVKLSVDFFCQLWAA